jgi:hypothetical protein
MNKLLSPLILLSFCVVPLKAQISTQENAFKIKKLGSAKDIPAKIDLASNQTNLFKQSNSKYIGTSELETTDSTKIIEVNSHYILNNNELSIAELRRMIKNSNKPYAIEEMEHGMVMKSVGLPFSVVGATFTFFGGAGIIVGLIMNNGGNSGLLDTGIIMASSGISHLIVGEIINGIRKKHIRESVELYNSVP